VSSRRIPTEIRWALAGGFIFIAADIGAQYSTDAHESGRYRAAQAEAVRFAARMGVVHGGCANESCSGLRDGKPVNYFCQPDGCVFESVTK